MQTFLARAAALFERLLPLAEQPADIADTDEDGAANRGDRLPPARDEGWYRAMTAHW